MIYFEIREKITDKILVENMRGFDCPANLKENKNQTLRNANIKSRYREFDLVSVWLIVKDDQDLLRSSKLFEKTMLTYAVLAENFWNYYISKLKMHSHTLRTIHAQMKQKVEGVIEQKDFRGSDYLESRAKIGGKISEDIYGTADLLCCLNKGIFNIEAHVEGLDILYFSDYQSLKAPVAKANIKKVLLNIISPFLKELNDRRIYFYVSIDDDYAAENQVALNYKFFSLALYNFLDNAVKYVKEDSKIKVVFNMIKEAEFEIEFDMISCKIDRDELDRIFDYGYSGRHADSVGDGIGMFNMRSFLKAAGMDVYIRPVYGESETIGGREYVRNLFKISKY